ncbi:tetratricopeptide repeat protein [Carboxylicivirga sp. A043]|uniref:tetratricopeptide repeat protein n=1 Tax=Carboxylicivirga litoralis TaxID=2816963 RepID=UPI0021CB63B9|nr:tetratricopeptide repeat protein [Carboxylicivirga sp. A043]MCU4157210.1 tetratricopeptide repeat protein [Carboxylicivirga sp. A043]
MKVYLSILIYLGLLSTLNGQTVQQNLLKAKKLQEIKPDSSILIAQKVLTEITDNDIEQKAQVFWNLAQAYLYKHEYHTALFYGLKGKELFEAADTSRLHQDILATIAWIYFDIGNYQHAVPYHQRALDIAQQRDDIHNEVVYTNALGLDALSSGQYQKALSFFQKAVHTLAMNPDADKSLLSTVQNNMAIVYINYEDWKKAEAFLLNAIDNSSGEAAGLLENYSLLAKVYLRTHQYNLCSEYLDKAELISHQTAYSFSLVEYYQVRYEYERVAGSLEMAYHYQDKYIQLYKKINNKGVQDVMNHLIEVQNEKIKQDELIIAQAQQIAFNRQVLIIVGISLSVIIIGVFYYVFRSKAERSLLRQKLLSQELEKKEAQQAVLSNKLAYKDEALESLALTISKRNELVKKMGDDVGKTSSQEVKNAWLKFEQAFNQYSDSTNLSQDLVKELVYRLQSKYPALTDKDVQLVLDIRNNLTSKELADKYHVEVKSIEMSRYRLRKKLNIEKGTQLKDFIMKL